MFPIKICHFFCGSQSYFKAPVSLLIILIFSLGASAKAQPGKIRYAFKNLNSIIDAVNLNPYYQLSDDVAQTVKIAVFDNDGFNGYEKEQGKTLPDSVEYHKGAIEEIHGSGEHGLKMAQIVYALMTKSGKHPEFSPELHFFNTTGYSNFKAAVEEVGSGDFDFVLNSQVWLRGGDGDGTGYINKLVSEAVANSDVIWFNSAGNFRENTFTTYIDYDKGDRWVRTGNPNNQVRVKCTQPKKQEGRTGCHLHLVLTWGHISDDISDTTDQDLDLVLSDDTLKIIEGVGGDKVQGDHKENEKATSRYPAEEIVADVEPGTYFVRIKVRSDNFSEVDSLRLVATGVGIELLDKSIESKEGVPVPADNRDVITVGAVDIPDLSSSSQELGKPDWLEVSMVQMWDDRVFTGSSNANSILLAAAAVLKSLVPSLTRDKIEDIFKRGTPPKLELIAGGSEQPSSSMGRGQNNPGPSWEGPQMMVYGSPAVGFSPPFIAYGPPSMVIVNPGYPPGQQQGMTSWPGEIDIGNRSGQGTRSQDHKDDEGTVAWALRNGCSLSLDQAKVIMTCPFHVSSTLADKVANEFVAGFTRHGAGRPVRLPDQPLLWLFKE